MLKSHTTAKRKGEGEKHERGVVSERKAKREREWKDEIEEYR